MNDFAADDRWQREMRDRFLFGNLYPRFATKFMPVDSQSMQCSGIDTVVQWRGQDRLCYVDEKIVRWPTDRSGSPRERGYNAFFIETKSCTLPGHESSGWIHHAATDQILYCFAGRPPAETMVCHLIDMGDLRRWFAANEARYPLSRMPDKNRSEGRIVPILDVYRKAWARIAVFQIDLSQSAIH